MNYTEMRELREKRDALTAQAKAILDAAPAAGMTAEDEKRFDSLMAEADAINAELPSASAMAKRAAVMPEGVHREADDESSIWRTSDGREIRALKPHQKFADLSPYRDALSAGKYLRGIVTGNWRGAEAERRAMSEGTLGDGGYLVPTPLAGYFIDRARNAAVCFQAGAQAIPMESETLAIGRVTADISTAWMAENAAQSDTKPTFDRVTLTAKTLSAYTKMSVELFEDAMNIENLVVAQLAKIIALELDRAGLEGTGVAPQPAGILTQTGVNIDSTTFGANGAAISGTTPTGAVAWDWLSKAVYAVRQLNEHPNAVVYAERTAGELDLLRASTGVFLPPPPSVEALQRLSTNAVSTARTQGTSNTASNAYVGNFHELLFGMRNGLSLEISREAADSTSSAFANRQVFVRVYGRYDVAVTRPVAFRVVEGIL